MENILSDQQQYYHIKVFQDVDFSKSTIQSKEFDGCTFNGCDFSDALLLACKFIDCHFIKCNFSMLKFDNTLLSDVFFEQCKMIGIDWTTVLWPKIILTSLIKFYQCILNDSTFFGLVLQEIAIEECKAIDVDFREGTFSDSNFSYTDFSNSLFNNTDLSGTNFIEAINYNIDIFYNEIKRGQFSRTEASRLLTGLDIELVD